MERIRKAALQLRRNRRQLRQAKGLSQFEAMDENYVALDDESVFDGVDATPEELVLYRESQYQRERAKVALLTKWALSGLATEMTMHEANGLLSTLRGNADRLAEKFPEDIDCKWLGWAARRLDDNFSFLTRFKASGYGYQVGPEKILQQIKFEFGQAIGRGDLVVEPTEAFLKSDFRGEERAMYSVFINLVRNSYQWSSRAGNKTAVVRLDAKTIEYMGEEWDEETDTTRPALKREDFIVVEDNGPGVSPGMGDSIFEPSISGRGSAGIGLHLCRAVLEASADTVVLSDEKSDLGGAIFHVGRHSLLRPDSARTKRTEEPREKELAEALESMAELVRDGFNAEAADLSDVYEEAAGLAMRIRLRGAGSSLDERLLEALDAFDDVLRGTRPISAPKPPTP
ncbi:ATP-binding protein [Pararhizobium sp. BT-229]|uniref:ATP-binding protein n=1 Tax=Pararhizobium sp. BT-229 TaxID=2986923 RepID=UPI0021F7A3EB|nr:ATP-binding protein [Pararhizobium sp. BT-229]MCV9963660.1 ATP-binding protein [Pararhizobium sp. BT-229]